MLIPAYNIAEPVPGLEDPDADEQLIIEGLATDKIVLTNQVAALKKQLKKKRPRQDDEDDTAIN